MTTMPTDNVSIVVVIEKVPSSVKVRTPDETEHVVHFVTMFNVYALNWNESKLLPAFLSHYRQAHRIVVYDNESTDDSVSIIKSAGREVVTFSTQDQFDDVTNMKLKNQVWKAARADNVDFVIVQDLDEFLYFPNDPCDISSGLVKLKAAGVTCAPCIGHQLVCTDNEWRVAADRLVQWNIDICLTLRDGYADTVYNKVLVFDPNAIIDTNYGPGCHYWNPTGTIKVPLESPLLLHYKYIGKDHCLSTFKTRGNRLSANNRARGYGYQYMRDDKQLMADMDAVYGKKRFQVTRAPRVVVIVGVNTTLEYLNEARSDPTLHVFAFEPNADIVKSIFEREILPFNYHVIEKAVSDETCKRTFNIRSNNTCSSLQNWGNGPQFGSMRQVDVECVTMADFIKDTKITEIEFLLIDTQGHDLHVLRGFGDQTHIIKKGMCESLAPHTTWRLYEGQPPFSDFVAFLDAHNFTHTWAFNVNCGCPHDEINITFESRSQTTI